MWEGGALRSQSRLVQTPFHLTSTSVFLRRTSDLRFLRQMSLKKSLRCSDLFPSHVTDFLQICFYIYQRRLCGFMFLKILVQIRSTCEVVMEVVLDALFIHPRKFKKKKQEPWLTGFTLSDSRSLLHLMNLLNVTSHVTLQSLPVNLSRFPFPFSVLISFNYPICIFLILEHF